MTVVAAGVPPGLGEPIFDRLDADLAHAMMGINAVKAVEVGDGFAVVEQRGSQHRDELTPAGFASNHAEDPIEFFHRSKQSQVIQRELGTHLPSFAEGVRAAMREDPDLFLVGVMRDAETISMAMTAAETGHLVLGTLLTTSAVKTIDRIIDALPIDEREQTKSFLALRA